MGRQCFSSFLLFGLFFLAAAFVGCEKSTSPIESKYPPDNAHKVTITQGVWGNVWFLEGNFEPSLGRTSGKITPVVREILVYEATRRDQAEPPGDYFFTAIHTNRIASVFSDEDGFYQIPLPPGKYSLFVREDSLYIATGDDGEGVLFPVVVKEGQVTRADIKIDYKATY
ncbi:MAG: hypothetical protein Kow0037_05300 [Calditrichia bacterium]